MTIQIQGIHVDRALEAKITAALDEALARPHPPTPAHVTFFDDNGPKNAPAIRCAITVFLPRKAPIHIERVDLTTRAAFDLAYAALARRLHDEAARARDARRRPKKYFVAKKLLTAPARKG